jgi:hypothetical protein
VLHKTWLEDLSGDLREEAFVHTGEVSASFNGISGNWDWVTRFKPDQPVDPIGFDHLGFAFHPGPLDRVGIADFNLYIAGTLVELSQDGLVDMTLKEWQEVVVPLHRFGPRLIQEVTFGGDFSGRYYVDDVRLVADPASTAVIEEKNDGSPGLFALAQNFPNPFNSGTKILFSLPAAGHVKLTIYNLVGQQMAALIDGSREAGSYTAAWDGIDDRGRQLASGVYFYRLHTDQWTRTRKLVLLR